MNVTFKRMFLLKKKLNRVPEAGFHGVTPVSGLFPFTGMSTFQPPLTGIVH